MRSSSLARSAAAAAVLALVPAVADAATQHGEPVAETSHADLPQVVSSAVVARPHVDAIATGSGTTYVAGLFDTMTQGGVERAGFSNIAAFDTSTGTLSNRFNATVNGQVWDLELDAANNALYVAGDFTQVNGVTRPGLVKLNATTGATKRIFTPYLSTGKVNDISLVTFAGRSRLLLGGGMPGKLSSVDPVTGGLDGYTFPAIADAIPDAWGGVAVYRLAVNPAGTRLIATGNFRTVGTASRPRFVMLNLGATGATVAQWYYQPFSKPCASKAPRRIAYLQGVDWSPTGTAFNVAATGQIPKYKSEVWHPWMTDAAQSKTTVCDAVGRFNVADSTKPAWVNYTGGDSVWRVQDTGAAVYASGHFQWLDNADGYASDGIGDKGGNGVGPTPAANRLGIGAVDPTTGRALPWAPQARGFRQGGKALVATSSGLWVGNDSKSFGGDPHYGLAFAPLMLP